MAEYIDRLEAYLAIGMQTREGHNKVNKGLAAAIDAIGRLSAADVAPVRHGEWIKTDSNPLHGDYYCSECQHGVDIGDGEETPVDIGFYYCANCGARMDQEGDG